MRFQILLTSLFLVGACRCERGLDYREVPVRLGPWPSAVEPVDDGFPDWTHSMRVWPFDILEPDMDASDIAKRVGWAAEEDADTLIFYVESEHMYGSFVEEAGFNRTLEQVEILVDEAAKRDLHTIVYVNGLEVMTAGAFDKDCKSTGQPTMASEYPDWLQVDLRGEPIVFVCQDSSWLEPTWEDAWISPLSDYRLLFADRIASYGAAGVDAIYIDATFLPGFQEDYDDLRWGSTDDAFAEAMLDATGYPAPTSVDFSDPGFLAFLSFRHDVLADYLGELGAAAEAAGMVAFWESSSNDTLEGTVLGNATAVTGREGLGLSPEIEPEGDWFAAFRMGKVARELNQDRPMIYLGWPESKRDARIEFAVALSQSGTYYPTSDIEVPRGAFKLMDKLEEVLERRVPWSGGLAVVHSVRNTDLTWENEGTFERYAELTEELIAGNYPYRTVTLEYLPEDGLEGFETAVLPGLVDISNEESAVLDEVENIVWDDSARERDLAGIKIPLPFEIRAPAETFIEYYQDRDGAKQMYLFAVTPDASGCITLWAAKGERLDVKSWTIEGEVKERSGRRVKVPLHTELTVLEVKLR